MQTRRHSFLEAALNTASGFVISYFAGFFIFPAFGLEISAAQNFGVVWVYTFLSIIRSYIWRRLFNHFTHPVYARKRRPF
jgi:hypothetical protein